jgi:hypothetical protein
LQNVAIDETCPRQLPAAQKYSQEGQIGKVREGAVDDRSDLVVVEATGKIWMNGL